MSQLKNHTTGCYPLFLRRCLPKPCNFIENKIKQTKGRDHPQRRLPLVWAPTSPHQSPIAFHLPPALWEKGGGGLLITIFNSINPHSRHLQDISPATVHWCTAHRWKPCLFTALWEEEEGHDSSLPHFFLNAKGVFQVFFCSKHAGRSPAKLWVFLLWPCLQRPFLSTCFPDVLL